MKKILSKNIIMLIITLSTVTLLAIFMRTMLFLHNTPLNLNNRIIIVYKKGETVDSLIQQIRNLEPRISYAGLKFHIKFFNMDQQLKAGVYAIKPHQTAVDLLEDIAAGNVLKLAFRVTEGTTWFDVKQNLSNAEYLENNSATWHPAWCPNADCINPEGLLLPETYFYDAGTDAASLLNRINLALKKYVEIIWQDRSPNIPYKTPYELLIAASIIEKETAAPLERGLISGVIVNRIKLNMLLQMDPTVLYAIKLQTDGEPIKRPLLHADLIMDSPYNTYKHKGLPPTPIAMPSAAAILAAAHPTETNYLYYVAKPDSTHQFSVDYQGQKRAIKANQ